LKGGFLTKYEKNLEEHLNNLKKQQEENIDLSSDSDEMQT
jgi:hypothetical protein